MQIQDGTLFSRHLQHIYIRKYATNDLVITYYHYEKFKPEY